MNNELLGLLYNILLQIQEKNSSIDYISLIKQFTDIMVNGIIFIGGVLGISYLSKLKDKNLNAILGHSSRLTVYIHYLQSNFEEFKDDILERFKPQNIRDEPPLARQELVANIIKDFSKMAHDTLSFLRSEDNQMPISLGWVEQYNMFLDFLIDCEKIKDESYYKWDENENFQEISEDYFNKHSKNMINMINAISTHQKNIEKKLYK